MRGVNPHCPPTLLIPPDTPFSCVVPLVSIGYLAGLLVVLICSVYNQSCNRSTSVRKEHRYKCHRYNHISLLSHIQEREPL